MVMQIHTVQGFHRTSLCIAPMQLYPGPRSNQEHEDQKQRDGIPPIAIDDKTAETTMYIVR